MTLGTSSVRAMVTEAEWEQRVNLAATAADNIPDAFVLMYVLESACTIQIRAQAGGGELIPVDPRIIAGAQAQVKVVTRNAGGALAWPGLLRKLDRIDDSFRG